MPLVITRTDYLPVFHLGATGGNRPAFWDQREGFGDTNLLVVKPEEGASLARALGNNAMVLMVRHGVTAVGVNVRDVVFRCYYSCRNAEFQTRAAALGTIAPLSTGEIEKAKLIATGTTGQARAWEYWTTRLAKRAEIPPGGGRRKSNKSTKSQTAKSRKTRRNKR